MDKKTINDKNNSFDYFLVKKNIIQKKYIGINISKYLLLIELLILNSMKLNIVSSFQLKNKKRYIMSQSSSIKLKIENSGNQKIFSNITTYSSCKPLISPDEIYINGENQSEIKNIYNFENNNNEITLIWYNPLNNTSCMFKDCTSITEIDLSNFDDSQLIKMQYMFMNCQSLKKIEISNIHGNKVNDAGYLFRDCVNLESIDLANFKAPYNVYLHHMFENCKALASLNYPNYPLTFLIFALSNSILRPFLLILEHFATIFHSFYSHYFLTFLFLIPDFFYTKYIVFLFPR